MTGARDILDWTVEQGIQNFVYTHKSDNAFQCWKIWASDTTSQKS
jgi:hypothetical protein